MTYGTEAIESKVKVDESGTTLSSGRASIKLTTDGTVVIEALNIHLKTPSDQSFMSISETGIGLSNSGGIILTQIELANMLSFNRGGVRKAIPNLQIAGQIIDVTGGFTVAQKAVIDESFFSQKWNPMINSLVSHMHPFAGVAGTTSPTPVPFNVFQYTVADRILLTTFQ
jgi:hypothetical protein